jgi:putative transposase
MDNTEKAEVAVRRQAIRLTLKGYRPGAIVQRLARSRKWLRKWQRRYAQAGWVGLRSRSRRPQRAPRAHPAQARAVVLRVRRTLQQRAVGLRGARAVQQELRQHHLLRRVPSLATINRWVKAAGLSDAAPPTPATVYYPQPRAADDYVVHAMDWTARYLSGGQKVFAVHTVDVATRALGQTLSPDKAGTRFLAHALHVWQTLGMPDSLQVDNDAAFTGGEQAPRRFGTFVRLCLYLGIEVLFIPPHEPRRNGVVERLNGLWAHSFWEREQFHSLAEVRRKSARFLRWYAHEYAPPSLAGRTPAQVHRGQPRRRLTKRQVRGLPELLPVTAGRLHFIRRVSATGEIRFLGESWKVGKRLAHRYVWATVITNCQRVEIYHRRSERSPVRLVKTFPYALPEPVRRLRADFKRSHPRRKMGTML